MNKQGNNSVGKKFSISLLKLNQIDINQIDSSYEFNAPKYFDLSSLPESPVTSDLMIDPWFLVDHLTKVKKGKSCRILKKKKHSQYLKENLEYKKEANSFHELKIEKKSKPTQNANSYIVTSSKHLNTTGKMSIIKSLQSLNLSKEEVKKYKSNSNVSNNFNNIKKIKRGISRDTYTYYSTKLKNNSKDTFDELRCRGSKLKINLCSRCERVMKELLSTEFYLKLMNR